MKKTPKLQNLNPIPIDAKTDLGRKIQKHCRDHVLVPFQALKDEIAEVVQVNPAHVLTWKTDDILRLQEARELWIRACYRVKDITGEDVARQAMMDFMYEVVRRIIQFPTRHSSTSIVDNMNEMEKNKAACEFIQQMSMIVQSNVFVD